MKIIYALSLSLKPFKRKLHAPASSHLHSKKSMHVYVLDISTVLNNNPISHIEDNAKYHKANNSESIEAFF